MVAKLHNCKTIFIFATATLNITTIMYNSIHTDERGNIEIGNRYQFNLIYCAVVRLCVNAFVWLQFFAVTRLHICAVMQLCVRTVTQTHKHLSNQYMIVFVRLCSRNIAQLWICVVVWLCSYGVIC